MKKVVIVAFLLLLSLPVYAQDAGWYAWVYASASNRLVLLNPTGEVQSIPAPSHPQESPFAQRYFAFSHDGASLAMVSMTQDERPLVLLRDLNSGAEAAWLGKPYDWYLPTLDGQHRIPPTSFSPDGTFFALGFGNPDEASWQVTVFETSSGAAVFELNESHPQVVGFVEAQPYAVSYIMPIVRLFEDARVHVQLVSANVQGITFYPTLVWSPGDDQIRPSDYRRAFMDIDPASGMMVYPYADENAPLPQSFGFVPPYNGLGVAAVPNSEQSLWVENGDLILNARWAAANQAVLLQTQAADTYDTRWELLNLETLTTTPLKTDYIDLRGTPDGFLSVDIMGQVALHAWQAPTQSRVIYSAQPADLALEIIWVSP